MLIGSMEGQGWRYEVFAHADGYLVQARDLDTGEIAAEDSTLFRTAQTAFAFADMSAAADRYAAARLDDGEDDDLAQDYTRECRRFALLRERLSDTGIAGAILIETRASRAGRLH